MKFSRAYIAAGIIALTSLLATDVAVAKVKLGQVFPDFNLKSLSGGSKNVSLSSFKGKVVVLDFWASWCEPCKVELPILNKIHNKFHARGLEIIGVNEDKELTDATSFLKQVPLQMTLLLDGQKTEVLNKLDVNGLPVTYVLDKQGRVSKIHKGFKDGDVEKFEKEIVELLK